MADEYILNNYSDDSNIKMYIRDRLMPRVFHDIPLNTLNTGMFSLINEYMSQALENIAFTSSFYFNEAFVTKAVLPDSIYAEASIFNIGYSYATPSSCYFLLELSLEDIYKNAVQNGNLFELKIDKNTKINLENGNVYSLDYDILIQYMTRETSDGKTSEPSWNVQYDKSEDMNSIATNKDTYITYRVTPNWLCLFIQANEYQREVHTVVNNTTNGISIADKVITCNNHIAGFDIKYIDVDGSYKWIPHDHLLPIHSSVNDNEPYIHYIMDNPQTIRFMFQLDGSKRFIPRVNTSYEITIYTCHGSAANFTAWDNEKAQPNVIAATSKYSNNANIMKACFVLAGGSNGGSNIGSVETVRRETIEAYNTANVLSTDHDIDEWFKTFYFKNILYPYFFKRRDDPWGRIWGGFLALKDDDDYIFRTNTLHANVSYDLLYKNNDNTVTSNEIIIPPGWIWVYKSGDRVTVEPVTKTSSDKIETAKTLANISSKFIFSNPFGIRIQKEPFAIGYFNPWINQYLTTTHTNTASTDDNINDASIIYHATPAFSEIKRLYGSDYYSIKTNIIPTIDKWIDGNKLITKMRDESIAPNITNNAWNYFKQPTDMFVTSIPMLLLDNDEGYVPFNPETTYFCVKNKNRLDNGNWVLNNVWIDDYTTSDNKRIFIPITGNIDRLSGLSLIWNDDDGLCKDYTVYTTGVTDINIYPQEVLSKGLTFGRVQSHSYYRLMLADDAVQGKISKIVVDKATLSDEMGYGESRLFRIGDRNSNITLNIYFDDGTDKAVNITNASAVYTPYECVLNSHDRMYEIDLANVSGGEIILYAEMKPAPDSGAVDYYRVPLSLIPKNVPVFYIDNHILPTNENNLRVVLSAYINGSKSGYVEMQPLLKNNDGSYVFETSLYPLNQLVDIDDRITIASTDVGGGSWIPMVKNAGVSVEASEPEFVISILIKTMDSEHPSEIENNDSYTGYRIIDEYRIDDFELVQELKEMRSVVDFGESSIPTEEQLSVYRNMKKLYDTFSSDDNIYSIYTYAHNRSTGSSTVKTFDEIVSLSNTMYQKLDTYITDYKKAMVTTLINAKISATLDMLGIIRDDNSPDGNDIDWNSVSSTLSNYITGVNESFESVNVDGGVTIQLVPMVQHTLMTSDRFESFVKSFTQVHKALEPIIFKRLEGNNYLDCKLTATYGLPHTYCADVDKDKENVFWPDLRVQIKFDVKLNNQAMATNTVNVLKSKVKSYFNKLTTVHTPADTISMDNNIYISQLIKELNSVDNVAYLKFVGFYTEDIGNSKGNFMDANIQAIVQKWDKLDNFPKEELSKFVPEMFILEDDDIVINVI